MAWYGFEKEFTMTIHSHSQCMYVYYIAMNSMMSTTKLEDMHMYVSEASRIATVIALDIR